MRLVMPHAGTGACRRRYHRDVELVGAFDQRIADLRELAQHLSADEWHTPVDTSIMLEVISGTTLPGSVHCLAIRRSMSSE